jgi:RNA-dependent RNA polymerase
MAYLKERRVHCMQPTCSLEVQREPGFGLTDQDPFFCIHYKTGIQFPVLFLVNAILHKGIVNQHQLSEDFFSLLRSQVCMFCILIYDIKNSSIAHFFCYLSFSEK